MITIGFYGTSKDAAMWQRTLAELVPDCQVVDLLSDRGRMCDVALVWAPPPNAFAGLPNLKGIILQGQGVDHMMADETVPRDVPLIRLVDPDMSDALSHWAILNALDFWRNGQHYRDQQQQRKWTPLPQRRSRGGIVGVMGVGAMKRTEGMMIRNLPKCFNRCSQEKQRNNDCSSHDPAHELIGT